MNHCFKEPFSELCFVLTYSLKQKYRRFMRSRNGVRKITKLFAIYLCIYSVEKVHFIHCHFCNYCQYKLVRHTFL